MRYNLHKKRGKIRFGHKTAFYYKGYTTNAERAFPHWIQARYSKHVASVLQTCCEYAPNTLRTCFIRIANTSRIYSIKNDNSSYNYFQRKTGPIRERKAESLRKHNRRTYYIMITKQTNKAPISHKYHWQLSKSAFHPPTFFAFHFYVIQHISIFATVKGKANSFIVSNRY